MDIEIKDYLLAIITINLENVSGGGCPIFLAKDEEEQQKLGIYLARILGGIVHDLENGVYLIVKH
ncbi:MAG TPA: hypothetical protein VHQ70_07435 [Syntrophomonadaceae bacterium]|nr:hypothetical protein [Syntrophomonadaceae bacterium]